MKTKSFAVRLLGTTSTLALSAAAFLASTGTPANAQATQGLYFGGSTLASEAFRQILDCYTGAIVSNGNATHSDGFTFSSGFVSTAPTPGLLPTSCTVTSTVQGLYAGVGNGLRGYIANDPKQWYGGSVTPTSANFSIAPRLPAAQPSIIDYTNPQGSVFGSYPYPRVDIALSDAPLPTSTFTTSTLAGLTTTSVSFNPTQSWVTSGGSLTSVTLNSTTQVVAYSTTATFGNPIQIPAFEVNLAIAVNVSSFTTNNSHIAAAVPANVANPGAAVQLTTAQLCAIFSGLVTDWNDSNTVIPYLDNTGTLQTTLFESANVGNGQGTSAPYSSSSLPINLVYDWDNNGTSFIIQNYLHAVCPLLAGPVATDTYKYNAIFGSSFVPSTSFTTLINQIVAARGAGVWNTFATSGARWIGTTGDAGIASTISDTTTAAGNIGYVSADFTRPFTTTVAGVDAPYAAALQDEHLRSQGIYFPNTVSSKTLTFIPPTPAGAGNAWSDSLIQSAAQSTWTFANYNVYGITFSNTTTHSGMTLFGQSVLPLTNVGGAYPLAGATFLDLYSCYSVATDSHRVTNLHNFLSWYYSEGSLVTAVIQNAAFNPLPSNWAATIIAKYLTLKSRGNIVAAPASGAGTAANGCDGVTGGAL